MVRSDQQKKSRSARVLIVTTDGALARSLARDIEMPALGVDAERSISAALRRLRQGEFHVLFLDADGLRGSPANFIEGIRKSHPGLIVVVAGSDPTPDFLVRLLHAGIYDFIPKPFDEAKTIDSIRFLGQRVIVDSVHAQIFDKLKSTSAVLDQDQLDLSREVFRANQELQHLNQRLKQNVSQLTILYQMGRDISENENWSDALDRFLMALVNYTKAAGAALLLFSEREQRLGLRSNFQVDPAILSQSCQVLLENWSKNPRGAEIHTVESYRDGNFKTCLERAEKWNYTLIPLRHRNRALGFLFIEKEYQSSLEFKTDYHFLNTIQTILSEEVANASYISELRQLGRFNQKVLDTITGGVITTDLEGRVRFFNKRAAAMCPMLSTAESTHVNDLFRCDSFGSHIFDGAMNSKENTHVLEALSRGAGDEEFPARLSIAKMHDDNLNGPVLVAIFEDLTEQRMLEEEVRRNDRLRVLGQLSAGVAHEIRNPLAGIATSAEVLAGKIQSDPDKVKYVRAILDEIHRLDGIIRNLLNFARPAKPQMQSCSLAALSKRVTNLLSDEAKKKGILLEVRDDMHYDLCIADENQMTQVLLNVVLNSIQACEEGDSVRIALQNEDSSSRTSDGFARVDVIDDGPGVPQEVRRNLFDPFVTTKTHGTGLGLAISQQIVEEHRGDIGCEFLERGTRFIIRLPMENRKVKAK